MSYVLLIVGLILLVKGADFFVNGSSEIARYFRVPALGDWFDHCGVRHQYAAEAAVSITAAIKGQNGIAVGNVLGSNLFNLLGVVGICALIKPMNVNKGVIFKEYPFMILSGAALLALGADTFLGDTGSNLVPRRWYRFIAVLLCVPVYDHSYCLIFPIRDSGS